MFDKLKKTAGIATVSFAVLATTPALAQVSPDILNLLIVASKQENGTHLDMVTKMAIAANPESEKDILALVANLKKNMKKAEKPVVEKAKVALKQSAAKKHATVKKVEAKVIAEKPGFFSFKGWDGEAELNFLRTSGNTSQQSFGLAGKLKREADKFHHTIAAFFDLNKNSGKKDKQKWGLSYKLDYDFSEKLYITSFAGYENDQFGPFRERITTTLGLGYPIIKNDEFSWKVEGGPSMLFTKNLPGQGYKSSFNAFASSIFKWTINDRSDLSNKTSFFFGNRSVIDSKTALKVKINGALSSKFSFDILYDRDAPVSRKKTDTIARAGLLYDF